MKPIRFNLIKPDGSSRLCSWAPWYHLYIFYAPYYNENLMLNAISLCTKEIESVRAYGVFERDDSWDPDSNTFVRHFPPLPLDPQYASYLIKPGDTVVHNDFHMTLESIHSYNVLDNNFRTLYELQ